YSINGLPMVVDGTLKHKWMLRRPYAAGHGRHHQAVGRPSPHTKDQPMLICFTAGSTSFFLGMLTVSTPLRCSAFIASASTCSGRRKLRVKARLENSRRV